LLSAGLAERNLKGVPVSEVSSTTRAAEMAAEDTSIAAIASKLAAEIYGLKIIKEHIEDNTNNFTRFLVISKKYPSKSGHDKTSILFSIKDKAGALYEMLKPFAEHGISLTKIESRPSRKKPWEYHFFVDMEGHYEEENVRSAIEELEKTCLFVKILGAYPAGEAR
jgi:chorismate mutase/prephenate dehydratase